MAIRNYLIGAVLVLAVLFGVLFFVSPSVGKLGVFKSSLAPCTNVGTLTTTTLAYMTAGTATTTATCYLGNDGANTATVALWLNASSSFTQVNVGVEESMDGISWYPIIVGEFSTTTSPLDVDAVGVYQYSFASTSQGGSALVSGANYGSRTFSIPVRMKQVRAYAYLASTTGHLTIKNGAVWLGIIPRLDI